MGLARRPEEAVTRLGLTAEGGLGRENSDSSHETLRRGAGRGFTVTG